MDNDIKRLSRLTSILILLQTRRLVTSTFLAEKFGISTRTIYRDIRALEQSGVPIVTEEGKGYSLMEGYRIAPVTFTGREANALITAEHVVLKNKDSSFIKDYSDAIVKVKSVLRQTTKDKANLLSDRIAVAAGHDGANSKHLSDVQFAITNFERTIITYQKVDGSDATTRKIEPFALLCTSGNWLLVAWCDLRKEFRIFRIDRIKSLQLLDEKFDPHQMTLQDFFAHIEKQKPPVT